MDWANEYWVKLYIRDTITWLSWDWETRALFVLLLRKVDRGGGIDIGQRDAANALSVVLGVPGDVADRCVSNLIADGTIEAGGGRVTVPNFREAQMTRQGDRIRKQRSRDFGSPLVTTGHPMQHQESPDVTASHERRERVEEKEERDTPPTPSRGKKAKFEPDQFCKDVVALMNTAVKKVNPSAKGIKASENNCKLIRKVRDADLSDWAHVIEAQRINVASQLEEAETDKKRRQVLSWLTLSTLHRPENFQRALDAPIPMTAAEKAAKEQAEREAWERQREEQQAELGRLLS
jgi:hypothetical protein